MKYLFALIATLLLVSTSQATHRGRVTFFNVRTYSSYTPVVAAPVLVGSAYGNAYAGSCGSVNSFNGVGTDCGVQNVQSFQRSYGVNTNFGVGVNYGVRTFRSFGVGVNNFNYGVDVRGFNSVGYRQRVVGFDRFGRPVVRNVRVGVGY